MVEPLLNHIIIGICWPARPVWYRKLTLSYSYFVRRVRALMAQGSLLLYLFFFDSVSILLSICPFFIFYLASHVLQTATGDSYHSTFGGCVCHTLIIFLKKTYAKVLYPDKILMSWELDKNCLRPTQSRRLVPWILHFSRMVSCRPPLLLLRLLIKRRYRYETAILIKIKMPILQRS